MFNNENMNNGAGFETGEEVVLEGNYLDGKIGDIDYSGQSNQTDNRSEATDAERVQNAELSNQVNQTLASNQGNSEMRKIVAVRKGSGNGDISAFKLDDGTELTKQELAERLEQKADVEGVMLGHSKFGAPYVRSIPDGNKKNNLWDDYPTF